MRIDLQALSQQHIICAGAPGNLMKWIDFNAPYFERHMDALIGRGAYNNEILIQWRGQLPLEVYSLCDPTSGFVIQSLGDFIRDGGQSYIDHLQAKNESCVSALIREDAKKLGELFGSQPATTDAQRVQAGIFTMAGIDPRTEPQSRTVPSSPMPPPSPMPARATPGAPAPMAPRTVAQVMEEATVNAECLQEVVAEAVSIASGSQPAAPAHPKAPAPPPAPVTPPPHCAASGASDNARRPPLVYDTLIISEAPNVTTLRPGADVNT